MKRRLGVNIDHVATLRQARGTTYPSIERATIQSLENGADQITVHLREDRRHIQDADLPIVRKITKEKNKLMNLETGLDSEILNIAAKIKPDWICLVPEKRQERTTEGGLNLIENQQLLKVKEAVDFIHNKIPDCKISLFLEANMETLKVASQMNIHAVEIHTGDYADAFLKGQNLEVYKNKFLQSQEFLYSKKILPHAGHGLTYASMEQLIKWNIFEEYNIGHWIIAEALFEGLGHTISRMRGCIDENS